MRSLPAQAVLWFYELTVNEETCSDWDSVAALLGFSPKEWYLKCKGLSSDTKFIQAARSVYGAVCLSAIFSDICLQ